MKLHLWRETAGEMDTDIRNSGISLSISNLALWVSVLVGLYLSKLYNFLLFHTLAELFSIVVAGCIFAIMWSSRSMDPRPYMQVLGISYLFVAGLDLLHTLTYKGMGILNGFDANLPTQLWISARYMEALSFVVAFSFRKGFGPLWPIFLGYCLAAIGVLVCILGIGSFPDCFIEGKGLTTFKIASEYIICAILLLSALFLRKNSQGFDSDVVKWLMAAMFVTILSEISFTLYTDVYGFSNMMGHYFKIISFFFVFKAIVFTGITKPFSLLFGKLQDSQQKLVKESEQLRQALEEVRTLRGMLPICSHCKKIRDEKGSWVQIEEYVRQHSGAEFTHGICPECLLKHYPEYSDQVR